MNTTNNIETDIIVGKVGSGTIVQEREDGTKYLDQAAFRRIGGQLVELSEAGCGVVTTTSGSMAAGQAVTGSTEKFDRTSPEDWAELQRLAGVGWNHILSAWDLATGERVNASMQLTRNELDEGTDTRHEALSTIERHLFHKDLLFVNENDAIAHAEIAYGDNDILAATLAAQIARVMKLRVSLVLLTDTHGVYEDVHDETSLIRTIDDTAAWRHVVSGGGSGFGLWKMKSKFDAADIAGAAGVETFVTSGQADHAIARTLSGEIGTHFTVGTTAQ